MLSLDSIGETEVTKETKLAICRFTYVPTLTYESLPFKEGY